MKKRKQQGMFFQIESLGGQWRWFLISNGVEMARYAKWYASKRSVCNAITNIAGSIRLMQIPVRDADIVDCPVIMQDASTGK